MDLLQISTIDVNPIPQSYKYSFYKTTIQKVEYPNARMLHQIQKQAN